MTHPKLIATLLAGLLAQSAWAQSPQQRQDATKIAKADSRTSSVDAHPLDAALDLARNGLAHSQATIKDYSATLVKRERINGKLSDYQYMFVKVRNRKTGNGRITTPFSVYLYFLKPNEIKGREVVYIEGRNNGKLCAHEGGMKGRLLPTVWLKPTGNFAMQGQLYPLTDIGLENLMRKLIERGSKERKFPDCEVTFHKNAKINGRPCTLLRVSHDMRRPEYEFSRAEIFIDDELNVPVRYAAYGWAAPGKQPPVLEEYTYVNLKINIGLTDADFDPKNKKYGF